MARDVRLAGNGTIRGGQRPRFHAVEELAQVGARMRARAGSQRALTAQ